jgi:DNA-binding NtrC family response regulator
LPATVDDTNLPASDLDIPSHTSLEELERAAVEQTLDRCEGNRTHAAEELGISVRTLQRRLKEWGIDQDNGQDED